MFLPLDGADRYLHWGWIQVSPANLVLIVLMVAVFVGAILLKMPDHTKGRRGHDRKTHHH